MANGKFGLAFRYFLCYGIFIVKKKGKSMSKLRLDKDGIRETLSYATAMSNGVAFTSYDLARLKHVSPPTALKYLRLLEREGFVTRLMIPHRMSKDGEVLVWKNIFVASKEILS